MSTISAAFHGLKKLSDRSLRSPLPRGVAGASIWLVFGFFLFWVLRFAPGVSSGWRNLFIVLQVADTVALLIIALPLLLHFIHYRVLWSLRSRLVLTYLLFGLAPIILFGTLVFFASYLAAGQFAIHLADSRIQAEVNQMGVGNAHRLGQMTQALAERGIPAHPDQQTLFPEGESPEIASQGPVLIDVARNHLHRQTSVFLDGAPVLTEQPISSKLTAKSRLPAAPLGLPAWATELHEGRFSGLVLDDRQLYLVAINQQDFQAAPDKGRRHRLTLESSVLLDEPLVAIIASGLGRTSLIAHRTDRNPKDAPPPVESGIVPPSTNVVDIEVRFPSSLHIVDWETGEHTDSPVEVKTRPSLLSRQLFGGSLGGAYTTAWLFALALLIFLFACIEALALYLALRVSHSITSSVHDLYAATESIDRGDFSHRIRVRGNDQLSELGRSFNEMTGSIQRLLEEQKEKERLQSELSIAQEVQANLFPRADCDLANLQLHGVCRPARSVSGDYYDFLVFHKDSNDGQASRVETGVGIALGDISGKGISAALLMATLHSAVRAYRFATEELLYSDSTFAGLTASRETTVGDRGEVFESPGRILSLLNRHLYRSTQPEKYATLFLAHYDAQSSVLTYSNAGQLPPLVLSRDGSIRRLDRGGTVVGLMDGMHYDEDRFQMQSGDILVAYSDGVTEPENDFGDFGEERLMEVVARYRDEPLHVISSQVMQALDAWIVADEQPDDITLVLARQL